MATFYNQATLSYNGNVTNSNIATGEILEVLSATKTAVIDEYSQNSDVTYVINIVNSGASTFGALTITDHLGAYDFDSTVLVPLTYIDGSVKYYLNGVLQSDPTVSATDELVISGISLPANSVATIIYAARANQFAPLATDGSITNTAVISSDALASDITVSETITVQNSANLTISKSVSPTTVAENGEITYTFIIQNSGNTAVTAQDSAVITDTFNPILSNLSVTFNGDEWAEGTNYSYDELTGLFTTLDGQITVPAATYTQDSENGNFIIEPGVSVLTITGTI